VSRVYTTDAIVLRRERFGEHGVLLALFTPDQGKVRAIAKGVHRPASKLAGHLEPLLHVRLLLARGRNLDVVTQAELLQPFATLRADLYRTAAAWYAVELVERLSEDRQENRSLYELLLALLRRLDGDASPDLLLRFFETRLLSYLGYQPALWRCAQCGAPAGAGAALFSPAQGGLHCADCASGAPDALRVSAEALRVLRYFQAGTLAQWQPGAAPTALREATAILRASIRALGERDPRSLPLLDRVRPAEGDASPGTAAIPVRAGP
jgi:DNA repair protein RecO (recombination protein O)